MVLCEGPSGARLWLVHTDTLCPSKGHRSSSGRGPPVLEPTYFPWLLCLWKILSEFFHFFYFCSNTLLNPYKVPNMVLCSGETGSLLLLLDWLPRLDYWSGRTWQGDREFKVSKTPAYPVLLNAWPKLSPGTWILPSCSAVTIFAWQCSDLFSSTQIDGVPIACQALYLVPENTKKETLRMSLSLRGWYSAVSVRPPQSSTEMLRCAGEAGECHVGGALTWGVSVRLLQSTSWEPFRLGYIWLFLGFWDS